MAKFDPEKFPYLDTFQAVIKVYLHLKYWEIRNRIAFESVLHNVLSFFMGVISTDTKLKSLPL